MKTDLKIFNSMILITIILIVIFLLCFNKTNAQSWKYENKRLLIGYDIGLLSDIWYCQMRAGFTFYKLRR